MGFLQSLFGRSSKSTWPTFSPGATLEDAMRELGIPLDFSVSDQGTALIGGLAKANIFQGYRSLAAKQWDEAIRTFTSVIEMLGTKSSAKFGQPQAVAYYLRGIAYDSLDV